MAPHGCSEVKTNLKSHTGAKRAYYNENELLLQVAKGVSNPVKISSIYGRTDLIGSGQCSGWALGLPTHFGCALGPRPARS